MDIKDIVVKLLPLKKELRNHVLYKELEDVEDIRIFMETHVYAVWDFMSLLKALQIRLTCAELPWKPVKNTNTARFINEIVLEEETDCNELGAYRSHFEMYLDAMKELGGDTMSILSFINTLDCTDTICERIENSDLDLPVKNFLKFTFDVIKTNETHKIAAAFTFGREELIPDMFLKILEKTTKKESVSYPKMDYYLKRHIELDGDDHGPLSIKMIEELCGKDSSKWNDVVEVSKAALERRIDLWNYISMSIGNNQNILNC